MPPSTQNCVPSVENQQNTRKENIRYGGKKNLSRRTRAQAYVFVHMRERRRLPLCPVSPEGSTKLLYSLTRIPFSNQTKKTKQENGALRSEVPSKCMNSNGRTRARACWQHFVGCDFSSRALRVALASHFQIRMRWPNLSCNDGMPSVWSRGRCAGRIDQLSYYSFPVHTYTTHVHNRIHTYILEIRMCTVSSIHISIRLRGRRQR